MKYWIVLALTVIVIASFFIFFAFDKEVTLDHFVSVGESVHWKARAEGSTYFASWKEEGRLKFDSDCGINYLLVYKGNDPEEVGQVEYELKGEGGKTKSTRHLPKDGVISGLNYGSYYGAYDKNNMPFTMTVKWDGKQETFELEQKKIWRDKQ